MVEKQPAADAIGEPKKRRRVGFSTAHTGIKASECIKMYLVSSKEQVGASDAFLLDPLDLDEFFDEDGTIYGYQGLKITIWVSSISFRAHADIEFQSSSDEGKGITDLMSPLQKIFGEIIEKKDDFLKTFLTERNYIRSAVNEGERLQHNASVEHISNTNNHSDAGAADFEVIRMGIGSMHSGYLYSRLVPLVLVLVRDSEPIDIEDPLWELYLLVQKITDPQGDSQYLLLGFSAVYRFFHYPDCSRLRLGQILVLPPYQNKGYGRYLLEVLNNVAVSENVYDVTVEEPTDYLQNMRTFIDTLRLLNLDSVSRAVERAVSQLKQGMLSEKTRPSIIVPPSSVVEDARKSFKTSKMQFFRCWEVLIYLGLGPDKRYMDNYVAFISDRVKADLIGGAHEIKGKMVTEVPSEYDQETSFVMFRSNGGDAGEHETDAYQEKDLLQIIDDRVKNVEMIALKVCNCRASS